MNSKIQPYHRTKPAYIYIRQSTLAQVRLNQESTERQYALKDKAILLNWAPENIRILDRDLGFSGAQSQNRQDFKTLVAEVSMGKVGAVFALEVSRLARSCADWHRLLELCSLTDTILVDDDGIYDLTDYNDQLLLGLKGTMSQAELHVIRARLLGGKLNKAKKGALRFPVPVGFCWDEEDRIILDPHEEVRHAVQMVFTLFRETGSAYGVAHRFADLKLQFPRRAYGGAWNGKLVWGQLSLSRVLSLVKNPSYAGAYVYGRFRNRKKISPDGMIQTQTQLTPMDSWLVTLRDHHPAYISWDEYLQNQQILHHNQTNGAKTLTGASAREGLALLQGLLLCGHCGYRVTVRYSGNGGIYPIYECNFLRKEGFAKKTCLTIPCHLLDRAIVERVFDILTTDQIPLSLKALEALETRDAASSQQWKMRIERADYEAQLAQRRYEEVDPSHRLVAASLEQRWNDALLHLEDVKEEYRQFQQREQLTLTPEQKENILSLAEDFPRVWNASSTQSKDRKRMLRLLIKDITVEKNKEARQIHLHIRWQGGVKEDLVVAIPRPYHERLRYPKETVEKIRELAKTSSDPQIVAQLNQEGSLSATKKPFTDSMVKWIRYKHHIPSQSKLSHEYTVQELMDKFAVSQYVVYYWIERGIIQARRVSGGAPYWITLDKKKDQELRYWVQKSTRINGGNGRQFLKLAEGGAV